MPATYAEFAAAVRALYLPPIRARATYLKVDQVLREFEAICPTAADVTLLAVARWRAQQGRRAPYTVWSLLRAFRAACRSGLALGLLTQDPFAPRPPAKWFRAGDLAPLDRRRHHSAAEVQRVLELADAEVMLAGELSWPAEWRARRLRALACAAAYTGARRNELLGARVEDLDVARGVLRLVPNGARPLKTAASRGLLPLPEAASERLALWARRCGSEWLFPGWRRERPWLGGVHGYRAGDQLRSLGWRAGVEGLTFQSLRHTYATLAESWGLGELELQRILRHSRPATQLHYRHADLDMLRAAAQKVRFGAPAGPQGHP